MRRSPFGNRILTQAEGYFFLRAFLAAFFLGAAFFFFLATVSSSVKKSWRVPVLGPSARLRTERAIPP